MRQYDDDRYGRGYDDNQRGRRRRDIDFDSEEFGEPRHGSAHGQRDSDWSDEFDERDAGRSRRGSGARRHGYENDYDDYDDRRMEQQPPKSFHKRHPVLMNFLYVCIAGCVGIWLLLLFLDFWTFHGEERVVPDVKGQVYSSAAGNVDVAGLRPVLSDSVFDAYARPGTVVEQTPIPGAKVKKGGSVYLTIVAFSPKLITVPDFYNVSVRQGRSMFEGLGIKEVREVTVPSEYGGLVLGAKFNGVALQPGARIPVSAIVTLEVGAGYSNDDDFGADVDTLAIDEAIEELNIE